MKALLKIVILSLGCFFNAMVSPLFGSDNQIQEEQKIEIGTSIINPIVLKGIKNVSDIQETQKEYIRKHYEGYGILGYMYTMYKNRYIQIISIEKEESESKLVYFDMTDVYKKLERSRDKKTKSQIKELMGDHQPLEEEDKLK